MTKEIWNISATIAGNFLAMSEFVNK